MNCALGGNSPRARQRGGIIAKLVTLMVALILVGLLYLVRAPVLRLAGGFWVKSDPPTNCDVIVVLSDDDFTADRATRAADLYHDGWAPRIVGSGVWLRPYISVADLMQRDLEARGVPREAIIPFAHRASDTLQELKDIRDFAGQHGWRRVMIVTSNYHTRRTRYLCDHLFPPDVHVLVVAAPDHNYDPDSWWKTRMGLKTFFHEFVGIIVAFWEVHHQEPNSEAARIRAPLGVSFRALSS
jgi:uncharacterized SAM-binding protein YcdF (DUF218 family)